MCCGSERLPDLDVFIPLATSALLFFVAVFRKPFLLETGGGVEGGMLGERGPEGMVGVGAASALSNITDPD